MSGTSADGVDAALLDFDIPERGGYQGLLSRPYARDLREMVLAANGPLSVERMAQLDRDLGVCYAQLAQEAIAQFGPVDYIALHGQTIRHQPHATPGFTLQIGSAADVLIATGITVVHDFRRADVAAGGEGAPLVPPFHQHCFQGDQPRLILNLGGMANLTWLPGQDDARPLQAFDCGPGNVLIDAAIRMISAGQESYDQDGHLAATGAVVKAALEEWSRLAFFRQPPPKSTGRELFGEPLVQEWWSTWTGSAADFVATLTGFTAQTVAAAIKSWTPGASQLLVFGGGAENPVLMQALQQILPDIKVHHGGLLSGIPSQALEALAFAWLGGQCLRGRVLPYAGVTGAQHPVVLGSILPGKNWPMLLHHLAERSSLLTEPIQHD
ncbi:MAG: anhydro-N-acetylmuramic acid kinase [Acidithiobacillus sp.]